MPNSRLDAPQAPASTPCARFLRAFMVVDLRGLHNQHITKFDSRGRVVVGDIHGRPPWRPELLKQGFSEGRRLNLYTTLTLLARWAKIASFGFELHSIGR